MNILLLNGETVQVVCFARALRKSGHIVSSLSSEKCSSGYVTRYVSKKFICYYGPNTEEYKSYLLEHLNKHKYDLIIPMFDTSAEFLSRNKELIEECFGVKCAIPTFTLFNNANNKQLFMELCEEKNICHPRTQGLSSDTLQIAADYVGFPAMVKPNLSAGAKGIVRVDNFKELKDAYFAVLKQFGACTLQKYIEQPDYYYNAMLYRTQEGLIAGYTIIKIRRFFPLKGGSSCYCETIEHPLLLLECKNALDKLDWKGFADFDVLEDKTTGELNIIEVNPRVPSSLQAAFAAGIDFGKILVSDYFDEPMPSFEYKTGMQVRWMGLDALWFLFSKDRFHFKPSWFRLFGKNVSYQDGSLDDPMPLIAGILSGIIKYLSPSFRRAKLGN